LAILSDIIVGFSTHFLGILFFVRNLIYFVGVQVLKKTICDLNNPPTMNKKFKALTYIAAAALLFSSCTKPLEVPTPTPITSTGSTGTTGTTGKTGTTGTTTTGSTGTSGTTTTPPVVTPPTGSTINVGDGKNGIVIDGKVKSYPAGTIIVVKAGTYDGGITVQNLTGVTIQGTGVILDGLNSTSAGFGNVLNLSNLTNVTITGITTINQGYRMVNINSRMVGLTLDRLTFTNCGQGIYLSGGGNLVWDGTDNTVNLLNLTISNSIFTNCGGNELGGSLTNGQVINLIKNITVSGNKFSGGNPGDILYCGAVDNFKIFNNTITNINANDNNDNRLFMMTGNGDAYNNTFNNYEGHAIGVWPLSFGSTVKTSHLTNNTCTNSRRYSAFEFQEFAAYAISGKTIKSDMVVSGNTCGNINTDHWTGYPGTFIDNYMFGYLGGKLTLTNNKGYNFFPAPILGVLWNLAAPFLSSGNTYSATL